MFVCWLLEALEGLDVLDALEGLEGLEGLERLGLIQNRVQSYNIFLICANKMLNNIYFLWAATKSWTELKIFCQIIYAAAPREAKGSR